MKIYLVFWQESEGETLQCAFSSKELAEKYIARHTTDDLYIEEAILDDPEGVTK